jgi:hypothetical protein
MNSRPGATATVYMVVHPGVLGVPSAGSGQAHPVTYRSGRFRLRSWISDFGFLTTNVYNKINSSDFAIGSQVILWILECGFLHTRLGQKTG